MVSDLHIHAVQFKEGERVVALVRRHWFHIAIVAAGNLALFLLAAVFVAVFDSYLFELGSGVLKESIALGVYALALLGLVLWMHFFAAWSDHWLDAWIITNERVIDIEQRGFFSREVSSFPLDRIQDVTYGVHGIIAMWLNFGDLRIQTASISDDLIMKQVPAPEEVKELIVQAIDNNR